MLLATINKMITINKIIYLWIYKPYSKTKNKSANNNTLFITKYTTWPEKNHN